MTQGKRILRVADVRERTGLGRTTIWRWVQSGQFPQPIRVGANYTGWIEEEIDAWIAERAAERP